MNITNTPMAFHCDYAFYKDDIYPYFQQLQDMFNQVRDNIETISEYLIESDMQTRREQFEQRIEKERQLRNAALKSKRELRKVIDDKPFYFLPLKWHFIRQQDKWIDKKLEADLLSCQIESRKKSYPIIQHGLVDVKKALFKYLNKQGIKMWQEKDLHCFYSSFSNNKIPIINETMKLQRIFNQCPDKEFLLNAEVITVLSDFYDDVDNLEHMNRDLLRYMDDNQIQPYN